MDSNEKYYGKIVWKEFKYKYELEAWPYAACPEGGVALDVGAWYGVYTLKFSFEAGEKGSVYAIEPGPNTFEFLNRNILLNKCKNVIPIQVALSNYDGEGELYMTPKETRSSYKTFLIGSCVEQPFNAAWRTSKKESPKTQGTQDYIEKTKVMTIDTLVSEYGISRIDIIKIDTEGGEPTILEGAKKTLDEFSPLIYAEVHYNHDLHKIVADQGYKIKQYFANVTGTTNPIIIMGK